LKLTTLGPISKLPASNEIRRCQSQAHARRTSFQNKTDSRRLSEVRVYQMERWEADTTDRGGHRSSAVNDVALGVEREFAGESANSAGPRYDPHGTQFGAMHWCRGLHDELLEAVLEASLAWMTAADPLCARLIDGSRQRLLALGVLRINRTRSQSTLRVRTAS